MTNENNPQSQQSETIQSNERLRLKELATQSVANDQSISKCKAEVHALNRELKNAAENHPLILEKFFDIKLRREDDTKNILRNSDGKISGYEAPWYGYLLLGNIDDAGLENKISKKKIEGLKKCELQR